MTAFSMMVISGANAGNVKVPKHLRTPMIVRCTSSPLGLLGIIIGSRTLPLTIFMLIINTSSFTTALMQYYWLKKPMQKFEMLCMVGCYLGVVLMVQGSSEESTNSEGSTYSLVFGFVVTTLTAVSISVSSIAIYEMKELHFGVI